MGASKVVDELCTQWTAALPFWPCVVLEVKAIRSELACVGMVGSKNTEGNMDFLKTSAISATVNQRCCTYAPEGRSVLARGGLAAGCLAVGLV